MPLFDAAVLPGLRVGRDARAVADLNQGEFLNRVVRAEQRADAEAHVGRAVSLELSDHLRPFLKGIEDVDDASVARHSIRFGCKGVCT